MNREVHFRFLVHYFRKDQNRFEYVLGSTAGLHKGTEDLAPSRLRRGSAQRKSNSFSMYFNRNFQGKAPKFQRLKKLNGTLSSVLAPWFSRNSTDFTSDSRAMIYSVDLKFKQRYKIM